MSGTRKLQQEVDRVMKQIQEGLDKFRGLWDRCETAEGLNREKLEAELKKEIKKLQRLRDTLKSWANNGEIKNKKPLLESRKLIEVEMERFKVLEKDSKMKAYSKEGLSAALKKSGVKDPSQSPDFPVLTWISETCEKFRAEIEEIEMEIESLSDDAGKRRDIQEKIAQLSEWRDQHEWHLQNLETAITKLQKGEIVREQVEDIQEGVLYFTECYREPEFLNDDLLYDVFDETEEDIAARKAARSEADRTPPSSPSLPALSAPASTSSMSLPAPSASPASASSSSASLPASTSTTSAASTSGLASSAAPASSPTAAAAPPASLSAPPGLSAVPSLSSASTASPTPDTSLSKPGMGMGMGVTSPGPTPPNPWGSGITAAQLLQAQAQHQQQPGFQHTRAFNDPRTFTGPVGDSALHALLSQTIASVLPSQTMYPYVTPRLGPSTWTNAYRQVPTSPLLQHMAALGARTPLVMSKLGADTLKFICNAQQGTPLHYTAARELKRQNWRFHAAAGVWVRRAGEVQTTEVSERGPMVVHDIQTWTQHKIDNMTFPYAQLEMDVLPPFSHRGE